MECTLQEYQDLLSVYNSGAESIRYGDKSSSFRSRTEIAEILKEMRAFLYPNPKPVLRKRAVYSSGIHPQMPDWTDECY
jgi:hypothetical protein